MIRKYSLVIEGDAGGYSGYVPELPTVVVTGSTLDELTVRAKEAVRLYWQALGGHRPPESMVREIEVDLPA